MHDDGWTRFSFVVSVAHTRISTNLLATTVMDCAWSPRIARLKLAISTTRADSAVSVFVPRLPTFYGVWRWRELLCLASLSGQVFLSHAVATSVPYFLILQLLAP